MQAGKECAEPDLCSQNLSLMDKSDQMKTFVTVFSG